MNRLLPLITILTLTASIPLSAMAEVVQYPVDPTHSQVVFSVRHILANVPGRFDEFEGAVWVDPKNIEGSLKVSGTVQMASVNTNNEKRDGHLRSPDFFDTENHPQLTFESKSAKKKGDKYVLTGDLTMRGVTKSVDFEVVIHGFAENPFTKTPMTALEMTGTIDRQEFGVSFSKTLETGSLLVGNDVTMTVHIEATVAPEQS
jgi:polyisoprenoid-binding protein YceI